MQILYSDDMSMGLGGPITLIRFAGGWAVVGRGYLCRVETKEEGIEKMAQLTTMRRAFSGDLTSSRQNVLESEISN